MTHRIIYNANIYTFDDEVPHASALATFEDRIYALGSDEEILPLARQGTRLYNLEGHFIIPGFVDAHIHWEGTAKARHTVNLMNVSSKADALRRIKAAADKAKGDAWVLGSGWAQDAWEDNARAFPNAADLDSVVSDHPVYLMAKSGHAAWVNSVALRLAGIDRDTADPSGGKIGRFEDGTPDGILYETPAMQLVGQHRPPTDPEKVVDWMIEAQREAWLRGIVGIHDFDNPSCLTALQLMRERGELGLRVVKQINDPWIEQAQALGLRTGFGDNWIRLGGLKIFADGALGPRTAAMLAPYEGEPDNYGVVVTDKENMYEWVSQASRLGMFSTIHAIGDRAVHDVLDVFEAVRAEEAVAGIPRPKRRHRIEHVQIIHPDDVPRLADLDIIASMQPIHAASDWQMADRYWGERARYSYNWRLLHEAGAPVIFGSDSPIDPFDPFLGLYAAVTRRDLNGQPAEGWYPEAKLTMGEALCSYTLGPAWAAGLENKAGKLKANFLADLIVLDRNLFKITPDEIPETVVLGTMVGGKWKHRIF